MIDSYKLIDNQTIVSIQQGQVGMSKFTQYVIQFGTNFVDLTLAFDPDVTLQGQDIAVKGSNGVDVVYADGLLIHFQN